MDGITLRMTRLTASISLLAALICGCNSSAQNADQALKSALKAAGKEQESIVPFTGKVLIDGKPPNMGLGGTGTIVVLWNQKKPPGAGVVAPNAVCDENGDFQFTTYKKGDGVPVGSYTICFAQLQMGSMTQRGYVGPDKLKNLYNDPDKNKEEKQFVVEVAPSGKTEYEFNLQVEGKEAVATPGPHAITSLQ
jgi:hypothetical protein